MFTQNSKSAPGLMARMTWTTGLRLATTWPCLKSCWRRRNKPNEPFDSSISSLLKWSYWLIHWRLTYPLSLLYVIHLKLYILLTRQRSKNKLHRKSSSTFNTAAMLVFPMACFCIEREPSYFKKVKFHINVPVSDFLSFREKNST